MTRTRLLIICLLSAFLASASRALAASETLAIDAHESRATIHVGKSGLFSFLAGHEHVVTGPIGGSVEFDADDPSRSAVHLVIAANALQVTRTDESESDVPKIQASMAGEKVLGVAAYPQITFESSAVVVKNRTAGALDLSIEGDLTIRDVTQPVTVPVHVELTGGHLAATGTFTVKQTAFGIKPISVAGVVAVKDELRIVFQIEMRP